MGLGWPLVKPPTLVEEEVLHGPAHFDRGASIQGLKRIAWAASDGSKLVFRSVSLDAEGFIGSKLRLAGMGLCSRRDTWDAVLHRQGWRAWVSWGRYRDWVAVVPRSSRDFSVGGCS